MATQPDQLRSDIEDTREDLAANVDRLADHTNPRRIAQRRVEDVKSTLRAAGDKVMGSRSEDTGIAAAAGKVGEQAAHAPRALADQARGNPLAAGLIAFGAGLLAASLLPRTRVETQLGDQLADKAGNVVEPLAETGREMAGDIKGTVREAASDMKDTAADAVSKTKDQVTSAQQPA